MALEKHPKIATEERDHFSESVAGLGKPQEAMRGEVMVGELSVVIVNWQNEERTLRCVSQLRDWTTLEPQIIVVDNESTPTSKKTLLQSLAPNELITSPANLGYSGGNNLGIKASLRNTKPVILLLNNDATIQEEQVIRLLGRLRGNPDLAILGPMLHERQAANSVQCQMGGKDILRNSLTRRSVDREVLTSLPGYPLIEVDYVPGAILLARRSIFEEVGLLDEQFFFSGEIADLCKRVRDSGRRVCVDLEVEAQHDASETPQSLRDTLYVYYSLRNRFLYAKKHRRPEYLAIWLKLCIAEFGKAVAQARLRKARAILLALSHAMRNRFGNQNAAFLR